MLCAHNTVVTCTVHSYSTNACLKAFQAGGGARAGDNHRFHMHNTQHKYRIASSNYADAAAAPTAATKPEQTLQYDTRAARLKFCIITTINWNTASNEHNECNQQRNAFESERWLTRTCLWKVKMHSLHIPQTLLVLPMHCLLGAHSVSIVGNLYHHHYHQFAHYKFCTLVHKLPFSPFNVNNNVCATRIIF